MGFEYVIAAGLAIFIFFNAKKRGNNALGWAFGTFIFWAGVLPFYFAKRYLLSGETREGGTAWNVCKYFVLMWTAFIAIIFFACMSDAADSASHLTNEYEQAGAGLGMILGSGFILMLWFIPTIAAAIIGFMSKKNSVIETGPTGPNA